MKQLKLPQAGMDALFAAVLKQAIVDYYKVCVPPNRPLKRLKGETDERYESRCALRAARWRIKAERLEHWFLSQQFELFYPDLDGLDMMCKIQDKRLDGKTLYAIRRGNKDGDDE